MRLSTAALLLLALLAGCPRHSSPPGSTGAPPPDPPRPGSAPASRPRPGGFVATVSNPADAYFAVDGTGLVRLRNGVFSTVPGVTGMVRALVLSKEGLWVSALTTLYLLRGEKVERIGDHERPGSIDELAAAPGGGTLWTLGYRGIGRFDGKGWSMVGRNSFGPGVLLRGIAVDGAGWLWISSAQALYRQQGQSRETIDTSSVVAGKAFYERLNAAPDGSVFVSIANGLLRCTAEACSRHGQLTERPSTFTASPDGRLLVVTRLSRISILSPDGVATAIDPVQSGFRARTVRHAAADQAGRFWLATDNGVVILDRAGQAVQWEPGYIPEVSGQVQAIVLEGEGPNLPALGARASGTVRGRVLRAGQPVQGATVAICEHPSMYFRGTPCDAALFKQTASTDEDGFFELTGVPVGSYRFAVKAGPRWMITVASDCCTRMQDGQTFDVGSIAIREL